MYEGELAFEREILISGFLVVCDCNACICKDRSMQRLGLFSQGSTGVETADTDRAMGEL